MGKRGKRRGSLAGVLFYDFPELIFGDFAGIPFIKITENLLSDFGNVELCPRIFHVAVFDGLDNFAEDCLITGAVLAVHDNFLLL